MGMEGFTHFGWKVFFYDILLVYTIIYSKLQGNNKPDSNFVRMLFSTGGIKMLIDKVRKYYDSSFDLNCAETIIYAANEEYNLNLNKETLKSMAAFGGGMGVESVCGAITGAMAVLGIMFTEDRAHESDKIKNMAKEFFQSYEEKLGFTGCRELKGEYRTEQHRCSLMIDTAAEILDDIIAKEKRYR